LCVQKSFSDASEPLALAADLALKDGSITKEVAEKLKEIAKQVAADEAAEMVSWKIFQVPILISLLKVFQSFAITSFNFFTAN